MKTNLTNTVAGDKVFSFEYGPYPQIKEVSRVTKDFIFIINPNNNQEYKYRRNDGSTMEKFGRESIRAIEPGEIEKFAQDKAIDKRIVEIRQLLDSKGFKFNGHPAWYSIEKWEQLAAVFTVDKVTENI